MANPDYPQQPPTPEQTQLAEQRLKNDTGDLALLAEFYAEKFSKAVKTATDPTTKTRRQKDADEMVGAHRRIASLVQDGYKTPVAAITAFNELEQGWDTEKMRSTPEVEEDEINKVLAEIRRARSLIEQNQNKDFYSDKEFSDWLKARNARLRETRKADDRRCEEKQSAKTAREIDAIREKLGRKKPEIKPLTLHEIDAKFEDSAIKTIEDIRRVVTPEAKAGVLDYILKAVDARIEQGKRLATKETGAAVEAKSMASVLGQEAVGRRYQFIASASEYKVINATEIGKMRIDEFLKKFLDYDLRSDQSRKVDLERYTNMID